MIKGSASTLPSLQRPKRRRMSERRPQTWFEMEEVRRKLYSKAVWIPLRENRTEKHDDGAEEIYGSGSIAFYLDRRAKAEKFGWSDIGLSHDGGPYASTDGRYKPCEVYQYNEGEELGFDLVFDQFVGGDHPRVWHLNQDLILALRLLQEGDVWVSPQEGYVEVVRQIRNSAGEVARIEIRSEFLRDYLAARGAALRIALYRERSLVMGDASHIDWPEGRLSHEDGGFRFGAHLFEVDGQGGPYGGGVAVFHMWRTDVDMEDEVPVYGPEDADNTDGRSSSFERGGLKFFRAIGEFWREEWIEPASRSERVRGDKPVDVVSFVIDGAGTREPSINLRNEDIGRWLWFAPEAVLAAMKRRGGGLSWHTADTGSVWCSLDYPTHFGLNSAGLVNVYAYDIAKLPMWQQRLWAGHNVSPDSPVSTELLMSQMKASPALTQAPEAALPVVLEEIDKAARCWIGQPLFKEHDATALILTTVHRFRALEDHGVLALAKDIARLIADRIDISLLRTVAAAPKGEKWGSLKSLEKALATVVGDADARAMLTPLVGAYELRLGDAHLPSAKIGEAFLLAAVDKSSTRLNQGRQLLISIVGALARIRDAMVLAGSTPPA